MEPQTMKGRQYQPVHLHDDRSSILYATGGLMMLLTSVAILLRLCCRQKLRASIGPDDRTILIALVLSYGLCAELVLTARFGSGKHMTTVASANIIHFRKVQWSFELTYAALVTTIKISILLFYRRVFPRKATTASFRGAWVIIATLSVGLGMSTFVATICHCKPISYFWNRHQPGRCLNLTSLRVSSAAINSVTDVSILILAIPIVWHLQITNSQKLAVSGVFLLGGFVCVASIIRLVCLLRVGYLDSTWRNVDADIWSTVEPCIGIVSACLPIMRPLLQKIVPSSISSISQPPKVEGSSKIIQPPAAVGHGQTVEVHGDLERLNGVKATPPSVKSQFSSQNDSSSVSDYEMACPIGNTRHIRAAESKRTALKDFGADQSNLQHLDDTSNGVRDL